MPVIISGSTGISGTDGSAATPAVQGTDTNTGMFFPAADQIAFSEGGTEVMRIDASGNVGIGTSAPARRFEVAGGRTGLSSNDGYALALAFNKTRLDAGECRFIGADDSATPSLIFYSSGGGAERMRITDAGNVGIGTSAPGSARLAVNGTLAFDSGYGSVATAFGCRAWVNFNGTGTVAIRGSGNVSSITDNGTGDYTVNFTTAMPDINYSAPISFSGENGARNGMTDIVCATGAASARTTSAIRIATSQAGISTNDCSFVNVAIFR